MHFRDYLKIARASPDPAGDFIKDARADDTFPRSAHYQHIRSYLLHQSAIPEALAAFDTVWIRFLRYRHRHPD
jgi:uncharacterized protein YozE (UPF0346 family)